MGVYFQEDTLKFSLPFPTCCVEFWPCAKECLPKSEHNLVEAAAAALLNSVRIYQLRPLPFATLLHLVWDFSWGVWELFFCGLALKQQRGCLRNDSNHSCRPARESGRSDLGAGAASARPGSTWEMVALCRLAAGSAPANTQPARSFLAVLLCVERERGTSFVDSYAFLRNILGLLRQGLIANEMAKAQMCSWSSMLVLCDSSLGHAKLYSIIFFPHGELWYRNNEKKKKFTCISKHQISNLRTRWQVEITCSQETDEGANSSKLNGVFIATLVLLKWPFSFVQ